MDGHMKENRHRTDQVSGQRDRSPSKQAVKYFATVGVLLVIIIALLAVGWVRERRARRTAQLHRDTAVQKYEQMQSAVGALLSGEMRDRIRPVRRDELPTREVRFENRRRSVLELDPATARKFGFAPGDLILVGEETREAEPEQKEQ